MAESASIGSSVEGEKIRLATRKIFPVRPTRCPTTNKIQHRFRLSIHGEALIGQAYINPQNMVVFTSSFTCVGDRIHGASLSGWALKPIGPPNVEKLTGTHSGSVVQISGGCLAQVDQPPREHSDSLDIQKRNPPITQVLRIDIP